MHVKRLHVIDEWVTMHDSNCTWLMIGLQCTVVIVRYWWVDYNARQWLHVIDEWVTIHDSDCTWLMSGLQCMSSNRTLLIRGLQCTTVIVRDWWVGHNARWWLYVIDEWVTMHVKQLYVIDEWVTMHDSNCTWLMSGLQCTAVIACYWWVGYNARH